MHHKKFHTYSSYLLGSSSKRCSIKASFEPFKAIKVRLFGDSCSIRKLLYHSLYAGIKKGHIAQNKQSIKTTTTTTTKSPEDSRGYLKENGMVEIAPWRFQIVILVIQNKLFHNKNLANETLKVCSQQCSEPNSPKSVLL